MILDEFGREIKDIPRRDPDEFVKYVPVPPDLVEFLRRDAELWDRLTGSQLVDAQGRRFSTNAGIGFSRRFRIPFQIGDGLP